MFSVAIHEASHGYVADNLGDPTARLAGRLTLNPVKHLELFGSFILPLSLWLLSGGSFIFGWAKPVPYNPYNLKNPLSGGAKIAAAGPVSNLLVAGVLGVVLRLGLIYSFLSPLAAALLGIVIYTNILLAIFNLVPLPPLDGSKVLYAFLPKSEAGYRLAYFLERYGMILVIFFIFFGFGFIIPIINFLYSLIVGQPPTF